MNWENIKYLLAFERAGSLAGAAVLLEVDATTVSRRLAALQESIGARLLERAGDGSFVLTAAGRKAVDCAEQVESSFLDLQSQLTATGQTAVGDVRISSVAFVINRILMRKCGRFAHHYPGITLHLAAEARNISLTRREADMAIRLGRPQESGHNVIARRIAVLDHAVYGAKGSSAQDLPWIVYHENMGLLPQARWLQDHLPETAAIASVRPNDLDGVVEAVAAGQGRSLLPVAAARHDSRLDLLSNAQPELKREVWLLQHRDQSGLARMKLVGDWLEQVFAEETAA